MKSANGSVLFQSDGHCMQERTGFIKPLESAHLFTL